MNKLRNITLALAGAAFFAASGATTDSIASTATPEKRSFASRLSLGGYGEVTMSRNFYSNKSQRYATPSLYKDESHGRFDIPTLCLSIGFDFGKGWSMGTDIVFEHGGIEVASGDEADEGGEYGTSVGHGGGVVLEQFWIQKEFGSWLAVRVGEQVVPVGDANSFGDPNQFFGVFQPEGESTIIPCTWHQTSLSLLGSAGKWDYQLMFLPGLDSERFDSAGWIQGGASTPFEFKIANTFACAARVDNYSVEGLRLSLSGYIGNSFRNTLSNTFESSYSGATGTVGIVAFDFDYSGHNFIARGGVDWGHLSDSRLISRRNVDLSGDSDSEGLEVASDAFAAGVEAGYDFFSFLKRKDRERPKLYLFGRYDYCNPMMKMEEGLKPLKWTECHKISFGLNYYPIPQVVVKGEYTLRMLRAPYNNEPAINLGIAYVGTFL